MNRISQKTRNDTGKIPVTFHIRPDRYRLLEAMSRDGGQDIQTFIGNPGLLTCPIYPCANKDGLSCKRGVEETCEAAFYWFIFMEDNRS
jgi:hypothetical protein